MRRRLTSLNGALLNCAVLVAAGMLLGGAGMASAAPATTTDASVTACAWTETVEYFIFGHNQCSYAVKWVIGLPDPLGVQATYTPCVQPDSMRDIARRGTPLKGYVRC